MLTYQNRTRLLAFVCVRVCSLCVCVYVLCVCVCVCSFYVNFYSPTEEFKAGVQSA